MVLAGGMMEQNPDMSGPDTCDRCRWWRYLGWQTDSWVVGECRKRAPHLFGEGETSSPVWPMLAGDEWCGDHELVGEQELERRYKNNEVSI